MGKTDLAAKRADFDFRMALCDIFRPLAWCFCGKKDQKPVQFDFKNLGVPAKVDLAIENFLLH